MPAQFVFKANRYLTKQTNNVHEGKKPKQSKISSHHDDFDQMIDVENSVSNDHNYCETCKDNLDKKPGDLCLLCDSPIDLAVKMS